MEVQFKAMAASVDTVRQIVTILQEEIGIPKARVILKRLREETVGNKSYNITINRLYHILDKL